MEKFDVIVAGAGTGGCLAAKTAAKAGLKTLLIDVKDREDIGKKICGDAIGKHHFNNLNLKEPTADQVERVMEGIQIYSPDKQTSYVVKGEQLYGYILNRHRFGQRLLKEAQDAGATLQDKTHVTEPIIEKGFVRGVHTKNQKTGEKHTLQSQITIEATGFPATIRKKLPPNIQIDTKINNKDVEACYREIRQLKQPPNDPTLCQIYLTQATTPGGYYWIFPEGGSKVNVGLGVAMTGKFPNPKEQLYNHVLSQPMFEESTIVDGGAWYVPTRRPLDSMVGNGVIVVGDAACQVNPIHGGGMGPSMFGGLLAGETAVVALECGDVSRGDLWGYNVGYVRGYGAKQAGLEIFRILLQSMGDEELNYGMRFRLLSEEDVLGASLGEDVRFSVSEKVRRVFRGVRKLGVLRKLRVAAAAMNEVKAWYRGYPELVGGFEGWRVGAEEIFGRAVAKFER